MDTQQKPWLEHYPASVPHDIQLGAEQTLIDCLDAAMKKHKDRTALTFMGHDISYEHLDRSADAFAAWLQAQGLERGSRVMLMLPNGLPFLICLLGTMRAGMVGVNTNPQYTERELEFQLADSQAQAIVILETFAHVLQQVPDNVKPAHVVLSTVGDLMGLKGSMVNFAVRYLKRMVPSYSLPGSQRLEAVLEQGSKLSLSRQPAKPDDLALLQYTGGTTGRPKGAMLSQRNLMANVLQVEAVGFPALGDFKGPAYTMMVALPLYHIFALTVCGLFAMYAGMHMVLVMNPRDLNSVYKAWKRNPPEVVPAVNTLFNALANHEKFRTLPFAQLKLCLAGGAALQKAVAERWLAVTGCPLIEGYGLSETSPVVAVNSTDSREYSGTIGFPLPSTDVLLLDEQGQPVAMGEQGEVAVKGPQVMSAYWNQPEETANVFTPNGFLKTGDIGVMDQQGRIRLVDRKKDMILVSGFNVYPNEIEDVVAAHPDVLEVAAVGVPSEHSGESIKLFVVKRNPSLTEADIKQWCKERLTAYKRPRIIEFRDELPKSNVGKILRRVLRDEEAKPEAQA
ncbi:AMP-binding protein [Alcaligenes faecalis]|uniref:AMP-binding protein n=1 Tax=Alcaligenes faecalis TaxID=511 RepID=UPI0036678A32